MAVLHPILTPIASNVQIEGTYVNIPGTPSNLEDTVSSIDTQLGVLASLISGENLWDRSGNTLVPHNANDNIDLGSGNVLTSGLVDGRNVSTDGANLDSHLDGGSSKHKALEIDVEGTYSNLPSAPSDLETIINDINSAINNSGASNFLDLTDTPNSYIGQSSKIVAVKTDETGLEFITAPSTTPSLTHGNIFVGDNSNLANDVPMSGEATIDDTGSVTLNNDAIVSKTLTGFSSAPGSITSADSILSAIEKLDGNDISTFVELTDTPSSYVSQASKLVAVKNDETGLEFITAPASDSLTSITSVDAFIDSDNDSTSENFTIYHDVSTPTVGKELFQVRENGEVEIYGGPLIGGSSPFELKSKEADGISSVGFSFDLLNSLSTDGSKIASIKNAGLEILSLRRGNDFFGDLDLNLLELYDKTGTKSLQASFDGVNGVNLSPAQSKLFSIFATNDFSNGASARSSSITLDSSQANIILQSIDNSTGNISGINIYSGATLSTQYIQLVAGLKSLLFSSDGIFQGPINGNFELKSRVADGAPAIAYNLDTKNTLSDASALLLSLKNNTVEKISINKDGGIFSAILSGHDKVLVSNSSGVITESSITTTTLGFLDATSSIQTQLNSKLNSSSFTDSAVTSKLITGFSSGSGTVVATDTILQAINKLDGNDALKMPLSGGTFSGDASFSNQKGVKFFEQTGNGTNFIKLEAPDALTGDTTLKLPNGDGTAGQILKTDGSGNLGWGQASNSAGISAITKNVLSADFTVTAAWSNIAGGNLAQVSSVQCTITTTVANEVVEVSYSGSAQVIGSSDLIVGYKVDSDTTIPVLYANTGSTEFRNISFVDKVTIATPGSHTIKLMAASGGTDPVITGTSNLNLASFEVTQFGINNQISNWVNFTPTITLVGGAGNTVPTFTNTTQARYTIIGKVVIMQVALSNLSGGTAGAGTGQVNIALPVTAGATAVSDSGFGLGVLVGTYFNNTTEALLSGYYARSGSTLVLRKFTSAIVASALTGADFNNAVRGIKLSIEYEID